MLSQKYAVAMNEFIQANREALLRDIQALVAIESVEEEPLPGMPFGRGPARALEFILKRAEEMGFKTTNLGNYVGFADYGDSTPTLAVLTHVDTVPIGDGWTVGPLSGEFRDGRIYGRGSYDDKGPALTSLYALLAVKTLGLLPKGRIRLIFGANEETGMKDMEHYLEHEPQPKLAFSPDSPFPVINGEKGIAEFALRAPLMPEPPLVSISAAANAKRVPGLAICELELDEKEAEALKKAIAEWPNAGVFSLEQNGPRFSLTAHGKDAAASAPAEGRNAIACLADLLGRMGFLSPAWKGFFAAFNSHIGYDHTGGSSGCAMEDALGSALTFNLGSMNTTENGVLMEAQIRYPVMAKWESVERALLAMCKDAGWELSTTRLSPAHYYPENSLLVQTLMDIFREETGLLDAKPEWMSGGTYARSLENAVAFGPLFPGEPQRAHGPDEYVTLESLIKAMRIYSRAMIELGTTT